MDDDFTMYKGTTQPVNLSVFYAPVPPATTGLPADLSAVTEALWACVDVQLQHTILEKRITSGDILLSDNNLLFNIVPTDDATLIEGQYEHEMRLMFGTSEYVVYPTPPGASATFTVYRSFTRGAEELLTTKPVFLTAQIRNKLWPIKESV